MCQKLEIINSRNDSHKFWSLINSLMPERIKSASSKFQNVNNCKISYSLTAIAKHCNEHFCNNGKALADKTILFILMDYCSYLSDPISFSMFFCPTSDSEIINIINQCDLHKSCGSGRITAIFVIFLQPML